MPKAFTTNPARRGFSYLELQVAFALLGIALAGLCPLVVMQSKQLQKLESRFDHETTYYLAPSASPWARKLAAPASISTEDPGPSASAAIFEAHINFQRPGSSDPGTFEGYDYEADRGSVFVDQGNGYSYGWNVTNTENPRNRNSGLSPDERYDTFNSIKENDGVTAWEIAIPDGTYRVRLVAGDPDNYTNTYKINVEGVLTIDGAVDENNRWLQGAVTVTVTDGRLTVSNATGTSENILCWIDVCLPYDVQLQSLEKSPISEEVTAHVFVTARYP